MHRYYNPLLTYVDIEMDTLSDEMRVFQYEEGVNEYEKGYNEDELKKFGSPHDSGISIQSYFENLRVTLIIILKFSSLY
jgi:hypothetical protein